jgi:hypothetical protein
VRTDFSCVTPRRTCERGQDLRSDRRPSGRADDAADLAEKMIVSDGTWLRPRGLEVSGELLLACFEAGVDERTEPRHQEVEKP